MVSMDEMFSARLMRRLTLGRKLSSFLHNEVGIRSDEARKVLSFSANKSEVEKLIRKVNSYWCRQRQKAGLGSYPEDGKGRLPVYSLVSSVLASHSSSYETLIDEARNVEKFDSLPIAIMLDPEGFHDASDLAEALNEIRDEGKEGAVKIIDPVAFDNEFVTGPYPSVSDIKYTGLNTDLISVFDNSISVSYTHLTLPTNREV